MSKFEAGLEHLSNGAWAVRIYGADLLRFGGSFPGPNSIDFTMRLDDWRKYNEKIEALTSRLSVVVNEPIDLGPIQLGPDFEALGPQIGHITFEAPTALSDIDWHKAYTELQVAYMNMTKALERVNKSLKEANRRENETAQNASNERAKHQRDTRNLRDIAHAMQSIRNVVNSIPDK